MKKRKTKNMDSFDSVLKKVIPELKELIDITNKKMIYHIGGIETPASKKETYKLINHGTRQN